MVPIGNTICSPNGTIGTIGKPILPLSTNGTIGKITNGTEQTQFLFHAIVRKKNTLVPRLGHSRKCLINNQLKPKLLHFKKVSHYQTGQIIVMQTVVIGSKSMSQIIQTRNKHEVGLQI